MLQEDQQAQQQQRLRRQAPKAQPEMISAEAASKIKSLHNNREGVFYRGDTRPPSEIFKNGFEPRGTNLNFENHFRYAGDSGYVSVSRGRAIAARYTTGHMSVVPKGGYVYVIAKNNVPDGVWVSGVHPSDQVARVKQEFMVAGKIPPSSISHVYEIDDKNPRGRWKKIKNPNYEFRSSPSCFGRRRAACDPMKGVQKPVRPGGGGGKPGGGKIGGGKIGKAGRIGAKLGRGVAFAAIAPFAHQILDMLKEWDHPIGHSVKWLDGAIGSVQEFIGGEQVGAIHGNTLKLKLICALRGEPTRHNAEDPVQKACTRMRGDAPDEQPPPHPGRNEQVASINFLADACDKIDEEEGIIVGEEWMQEAAESCADLRSTVEMLGC
ncbi:hypothetical protein LLEC1_02080 [Akanthomyces lecanii]|uniref:Pierisin-like domain-containing protein n=1 Tax=Cordyceps confragosa TaxID=2714763 RepID=A0A179I6G6_CORDF|nr:hypothetical protein LLEC1_02080 [Akanthomyces lecanii]